MAAAQAPRSKCASTLISRLERELHGRLSEIKPSVSDGSYCEAMMTATLSQVLTEHHKACDEEWALAEEHALEGRWAEAAGALKAFVEAMERHLSTEEAVLFPAFEAATGMRGGPTQMMRHEHAQMRQLFGELEAAVVAKDGARFSGAGETMLVLMQQHNLKEEHILYPACDQALQRDAALLTQVEAGVAGRRA
jgi:iron-sulfur cluster repair protein YtfE (RIC family)